MNIQAKIENLKAQHAQTVQAYQQAQAQMEQSRTLLIKIEGALDVLRELSQEEAQGNQETAAEGV